MIRIWFLSIIVLIGMFKFGYRMNWEITSEKGKINYISVKKPFRKFFTLKNSSDKIINVALYIEIFGYIFFVILAVFNIISFWTGFVHNVCFMTIYYNGLIYILMIECIYIIVTMGLYKYLCWKSRKTK